MAFPHHIKIVEVAPRDGLQNEKQALPVNTIIDFINQLSETGLSVIETASFVSPKWIPQLANSKEVFLGIQKAPHVHYPVLVPNLKGLEAAIEVGAKEVAVFTTPSEQFSRKNANCSVTESLHRIAEVVDLAKKNRIRVRAYLSCVLGCPYEGKIAPEKVGELGEILLRMGCYEVSLGDTIGVGTPPKIKRLLEIVSRHVPLKYLAIHFHDTYGLALVNIYSALEFGVGVIDCSVAGLGGCPYAQGASGNVATEDVVHMLDGMGIETGINLKKLIAAGRFISKELDRMPQSKVNLALGGPISP
jgi:isopropylmalate/homocitrate/citramalate synthase